VPYSQEFHLYQMNYRVSIYEQFLNLSILDNLQNQKLNSQVSNLYGLYLKNADILVL